ncbi:uncharacterized protein YbbK (DUF523 family) [Desulfobaculum xiamenense]|uniref:Uncharacterized protein YbbK (DUF523 family) n=1 Tax=Desulfobaculum xiamenense TaxID=995050 RepID=A0A846QMT6_9BACT|nr:DUF523 domain-containing protein [Desulfobaculum xiamenense]NJB69411.1 uncharacterized protein YbbK (DUF523 family) [Desulfobaculum xiamenense]
MSTKKDMVVVSACLAGCPTRYDAKGTPCDAVLDLIREGRAIPLCPEQLGGLPAPRPCCERLGDRVMNAEGEDVTDAFERGAREALRIAQLAGCRTAVLKQRSPTCGNGIIYDGTFTSKRIPGDGVFAEMCRKAGMTVMSEDDLTAQAHTCAE